MCKEDTQIDKDLASKLEEELKTERTVETGKESEFIKTFLEQNPFKVIIKFFIKSLNF
jgi:hypothetical protein